MSCKRTGTARIGSTSASEPGLEVVLGVISSLDNHPAARFASVESSLLSVVGSMPSEDRIPSVLQEIERLILW